MSDQSANIYQCVKFGVNRIKIANFKYQKKPKLVLTSRDDTTVRHTSSEPDTSERAIDKEHFAANRKSLC